MFIAPSVRWVPLLLGVASCSRMSNTAAGSAEPATNPPSTTYVEPEPDERHLANIRQLTFGGNNAEAYFSSDGKRIIYQWQQKVDEGCDQQYIMNADGSNIRRVSNGQGRTTCGAFIDRDRRVLYSSMSPSFVLVKMSVFPSGETVVSAL